MMSGDRVLPLLNAVPLTRIILHPRIGRQQYKGMVYKKELRLFAEMCQHPLVYNGDLHTPDDIRRIEEEYPDLDGVMIGRGLLANPALAMEYREGIVLPREELYAKVNVFHNRLFYHYESYLQGGTQLLSKIKPYWEYLLPDMDKKLKKAILKASHVDKYLEAVGIALMSKNIL